MAIIRGYQPIKQLVHHFDLDIGRLEHVGTVDLFKLLVPFPLPSVNVPVLLQLLLNHRVGLLHDGGEGEGWLGQQLLV